MRLQKTLWTPSSNHHLHRSLLRLLPSLRHSALPLAQPLLVNLRSDLLNQVHSALQPLAHLLSPLRLALPQHSARLLPQALLQVRLALQLRLVSLPLAPPQSRLHLLRRLLGLLVPLPLGRAQHRLNPQDHQLQLLPLPLLALPSQLSVDSVSKLVNLQRSANQPLDRQLPPLPLANHLPRQRLGASLHLTNRPLVRLTSLLLPRHQLSVRLPLRLLLDNLVNRPPLLLRSARHLHHLPLANLINPLLPHHPLLIHQLQRLLLSLGSGLNQQEDRALVLAGLRLGKSLKKKRRVHQLSVNRLLEGLMEVHLVGVPLAQVRLVKNRHHRHPLHLPQKLRSLLHSPVSVRPRQKFPSLHLRLHRLLMRRRMTLALAASLLHSRRRNLQVYLI